MNDAPNPQDKPNPRMRRSSRYGRMQERRAAQKAADNRFYKGIFGLITLLVLVTLMVAALAMNGGGGLDMTGLQSWTNPWLGPFSKMEIAGLVVIAIIAVFMYRRIARK